MICFAPVTNIPGRHESAIKASIKAQVLRLRIDNEERTLTLLHVYSKLRKHRWLLILRSSLRLNKVVGGSHEGRILYALLVPDVVECPERQGILLFLYKIEWSWLRHN
jgi:hypothetical protein